MLEATDNTLTILLSPDDWARIKVHWPESLHGRILALDPDIHATLSATRISHLTPWDFVAPADWAALQALECAARAFWESAASAPYRGLDLFRVAPFRHEEWIARCTWLAFVLERAFNSIKPQVARMTAADLGHGLTAPPGENHFPPLTGLVRYFATRHGCELQTSGESNNARLESGRAKAQESSAPSLEQLLPDAPYVLFYANHVDVCLQLPLIRTLRSHHRLEAVQIFKIADAATWAEISAAGHRCYCEDQIAAGLPAPWSPDSPPLQVRELYRTARARFANNDALRPAALFDNPALGPHFDFLFGAYLRKMAWNVDLWRAVFEIRPPQLLVVSDQLPIAAVAESIGVPVLSLPHGLMVGETNWNSRLTPTIGALTPRHRDLLRSAGVSAGQVRITGSPGLDHVLRPASVRKTSVAGTVPENRTILICTSNFGLTAKLHSLPRMNWKRGLEIMRELMELPARHPGWRLIIKAHPRFDHAAAYRLLAAVATFPGQVVVETGGRLDELVARADAVIFPNPLTSSLIECAHLEIPVYLLRGAMIEYDAMNWALDGWPHFDDVDGLEAALTRDFATSAAYQAACEQTRAGLDAFLGDDRRTSGERLAAMISESGFKQRRGSKAGAENRFPGNTEPVFERGGIHASKIDAVPHIPL